MKSLFRNVHKGLSWLVTGLVLVQFFLAGVWHAEVIASPEVHVMLGLSLVIGGLLLLISAVAGVTGRRLIGLSALLFVLLLLQPVIIEQRRLGAPFISAFHALNGVIIFTVAFALARANRSQEAANATAARTAAATD